MHFLLRLATTLLFVVTLSACGLVVPPTLETPPALCKVGQVSTEAEPCTARPVDTTTSNDSTNTSGNPSSGSDTSNNPSSGGSSNPSSGDTSPSPQPAPTTSCFTTPAKVTATAKLTSQTTLKGCYAPGDADSVYVSLKLKDDTVTFTKPTVVFDIVRVNADNSTTSMSYHLLAGVPSANPDVFRGTITKEMLLMELETAVSLEFKSTAPAGKYLMVISLFVNSNAYDPTNLVGRVFYAFEVKKN